MQQRDRLETVGKYETLLQKRKKRLREIETRAPFTFFSLYIFFLFFGRGNDAAEKRVAIGKKTQHAVFLLIYSFFKKKGKNERGRKTRKMTGIFDRVGNFIKKKKKKKKERSGKG